MKKIIKHGGNCGGTFYPIRKRIVEEHAGYTCHFTAEVLQCDKCLFYFKPEAIEKQKQDEIIINTT